MKTIKTKLKKLTSDLFRDYEIEGTKAHAYIELEKLGITEHKSFHATYIKPYLTDDKPANRELFNIIKDNLHKDGLITDRQVLNWCYPTNLKFMSKEEIKHYRRNK